MGSILFFGERHIKDQKLWVDGLFFKLGDTYNGYVDGFQFKFFGIRNGASRKGNYVMMYSEKDNKFFERVKKESKNHDCEIISYARMVLVEKVKLINPKEIES